MADKEPIFTRDFTLLFIGRSTSAMVFSMTTATIATYALDFYGASIANAGVAVGAFIVGALVVRLVAGQLMGWVGCRKLTLIACVYYAVMGACYFIPLPFEAFVVLRFLHGMGFGIAGTSFNVIGSLVIPRSRYGEGMGIFSLAGTLSGAVGPFVGVTILQYGTYEALFVAITLCALVSFTTLVLSHAPEPPVSSNLPPKWHFSLKPADVFEVSAIPFSALAFLIAMCYAAMNSMLNTYATSLGIQAFVPWAFISYSVIASVSRPLAGHIIDIKGDNIVMYPAFISDILGLILLGFATSGPMILIAAALVGLGHGTLFSTMQTITMREASSERLGHASSTFYIFADGGQGIGPAIMGGLAGTIGFQGMYFAAAAIVLVATLLYGPVHSRMAR